MRGLLIVLVLGLGATRSLAQPPPPAPTPAPKGKITKQPKLLQAVAPDYPPAALAAGKTAKVKVRISIDATGIVEKVEVVDKVGDGFDEAAVAAAMQYVFEPTEFDGKPGQMTVETAINFVIEEQVEVDPTPPPPPKVKTGPPNHAGNMDLPVSIEDVVVERGTRRKLAGVIVSIKELGLDVVTGEDGSFYFHGISQGTYVVLA